MLQDDVKEVLVIDFVINIPLLDSATSILISNRSNKSIGNYKSIISGGETHGQVIYS